MHEVESNFYTGAVPWHGLGKALKEPPTPKQAVIEAGLDWDVELKDQFLQRAHGSYETVGLAKFTVRKTDGRVLGVVGPDYGVLQNAKAFDWFEPFVKEGVVTLETAGSLRGGKRVWVLARVKADPVVIVKGDEIERFILLSNSHDGTMSARAGFTATRVVCWNTLSYAHNSPASKLLRIRHTKNIEDAITAVRDVMDVADQEFVATIEQFKAMAKFRVEDKDVARYVRRVFKPVVIETTPENADAAEAIQRDEGSCDRLVSNIVPLFHSGRGNTLPGVEGTLWAAYNAVTDYLTHERGSDKEVRLDSQWFGDSAKLGLRAIKVAQQMMTA